MPVSASPTLTRAPAVSRSAAAVAAAALAHIQTNGELLTVAQPTGTSAVGSLPVLDGFDDSVLNPAWSQSIDDSSSGAPLPVISAGSLFGNYSGSTSIVWSRERFAADQAVALTVTAKPTLDGKNIHLGVRISGALTAGGLNGYQGYLYKRTSGGDNFEIIRRDLGVVTSLTGLTSFTWATGDNFELRSVGSQLSLWQQAGGSGAWTQLASVTDTTYPDVGRVNVGGNGPNWKIDNLCASSIPFIAVARSTAAVRTASATASPTFAKVKVAIVQLAVAVTSVPAIARALQRVKVLTTSVRTDNGPRILGLATTQAAAATFLRAVSIVRSPTSSPTASRRAVVARSWSVSNPPAARLARQPNLIRTIAQPQSASLLSLKAKFANFAATVGQAVAMGRALPRNFITGAGMTLPPTFISVAPVARVAFVLSGKAKTFTASLTGTAALRRDSRATRAATAAPAVQLTRTTGRVAAVAQASTAAVRLGAAKALTAVSVTVARLANRYSFALQPDPVSSSATVSASKLAKLVTLATSLGSAAVLRLQTLKDLLSSQGQTASVTRLPLKELDLVEHAAVTAKHDLAVTLNASSPAQATVRILLVRVRVATVATVATLTAATVRARVFQAAAAAHAKLTTNRPVQAYAAVQAAAATLTRRSTSVRQASQASSATVATRLQIVRSAIQHSTGRLVRIPNRIFRLDKHARARFTTDHPAMYRFRHTGHVVAATTGRVISNAAGRIRTLIERLDD